MLRSIGINLRGLRSFSTSKIAFQQQISKTGGPSSTLNWVQFLNLKKENSRVNLVSSVITAFIGSTISWGYISNLEIDVEKPLFGFDPFMVLCGGIFLGTGLGYLVGPFLGSGLFKLKNKNVIQQFKAKDKIFFQHIAKNRVDPSSQSFSNPVPDYYGEKIYSLKDYKQWLRDCNAFKRKSREFI